MELIDYLLLLAICAVAYAAGEGLARVHIPRLPVYLAVGAISGALVARAQDGASLTFPRVSTVALAFIGFVAGSHLVWRVIAPRLRPIIAQVLGLSIAVPIVVGITIFVVTSELPMTVRLAGAILAGTVMLALSPPEAIAVISENRSAGPFTKLVLGATVVMDVVVVSAFSVTLLVAQNLVEEEADGASIVASVVAVLGLALLGGALVGFLLRTVIERTRSDLWVGLLVIAVAAVAAVLAPLMTEWAADELGLRIEIDSLLIAMIAGVIVANWTTKPERFAGLLERMVPYVYVVFFTLTGLGLHLDALAAAAGAAALLWVARLAGIATGSTVAMRLVREPEVVRRVAWRAYMPQAGIALALAATIASDFGAGGEELATIIIATVVLNEATGPFFLRSALRATGETVVETEQLD
ncbi:cation:proton antiporter domain-containing protein [Longivirga aurantiaca]|uniref:Cation:proton antiporter n=1 Tax=Longivirga aurantiaca TaxID=1837743 RepID=A0ABW1T0D0_9ACTN